ncbi:MAG: penicillin-binding protein activator LpoB, partial [Nitrospiraceae bacterium]|nr:penicillin-binding protein activator LpoB [Nitrospiraceae bacterium]
MTRETTGRRGLVIGAALMMLAAAGCSSYSVQRVSVDTSGGVTSRWTDTDARLTAQTMIKKALEAPWLRRFRDKNARRPVVEL